MLDFSPSSRGDVAAFAYRMKGDIICGDRITSKLEPDWFDGFTT